ncbi:MAG: ABC transporter substrate-binding protein [Actinomycetota bacterium]|nr:ABC transporter substrate-binding protein [Actinomycetota bacterium]
MSIQKNRNLRYLGAGTLATAMLLAAVPSYLSGSADAAVKAHAAAGALTIAISGQPQSLDPSKDDEREGLYAAELLYEPLINETYSGKFIPGLASSWKYIGTGNKRFQMTIAQGIKFADGEPVNAAAVVAGLQYNAKGSGPAASNFNGVTVKATGPYTVLVTTTVPNPEFPLTFSQGNLSGDIVCPNALANAAALASVPCGAGPYVLDSSATVIGSKYVFTPNGNYYNPSRIHYSSITLEVISSPTSALNAIKTGQVQILDPRETVIQQYAPAKAAGLNVDVLAANQYLPVWIMDRFGKTVPALGNLKVRQALNYAIDRPAIAKVAFGFLGSADDEPTTPGWDGYNPKLSNYYNYNPNKAKALLKAAGYAKGFSFKILYITSETATALGLQAMAQEWAAIGVKAILVPESGFPPFSAAQTTLKYSAFELSWPSGDLLSTANLLWFGKTGANAFNASSPAAFKLYRAALSAPSSQTFSRFQAVGAYITTNAYAVVAAMEKSFVVATSGVKGLPTPGSNTPGGFNVVNVYGG